jgi:D-alanyl-D-alanine carboxypeptidase/D-alanyl-D-alanine-endopeptidase (penicillin-binding protein 4)
MKKTISILALLFATLTAGAQQIADLEKTVSTVQRENGMQHSTLAVSVYNITKGKQVYSYNSQMSLTPGSVMKLFTTSVGFARLGSDFRFVTRLKVRGTIDRDGVLHGNVYILGGGDPMLGSYRYSQTSVDSLFDSWMQAIKKKGIRRIDGRVCYYVNIFDEQQLHDSWEWGDVGNYYGAGVSGLNFHENMYFIYFKPGTKVGYPAADIRVVPKNIGVVSTNEVTTGPEGSGDNVIVYGSPTTPQRLYRGTVPLTKGEFRVRAAMPNPAKQCADLFSSYLRTHGVSVSNNAMQIYALPDSLRSTLDYYSSDYYTLAQYTNLTSNNVYAESIFKYLGYDNYGRGTFSNGSRVVTEYFKEKKLEYGGVNVADGSGLSTSNRVTTDFVCRYLMTIAKESYFPDFFQTLAKVGESGTAKNLLPNLPAGLSVHLKTGTIQGVKAYAGYVDAANGDRLAFAIICNNHECTSSAAADKLNKILYKVATLY